LGDVNEHNEPDAPFANEIKQTPVVHRSVNTIFSTEN
jgi:hypothetical protein